jgi:dihydroorotate dehydrogenase
VLAQVYMLSEGKLPLIGVGGVDSGAAALAKIEAGASLVQLYTGMIYSGAALVSEILSTLSNALDAAGADHLSALRGARAAGMASRQAA